MAQVTTGVYPPSHLDEQRIIVYRADDGRDRLNWTAQRQRTTVIRWRVHGETSRLETHAPLSEDGRASEPGARWTRSLPFGRSYVQGHFVVANNKETNASNASMPVNAWLWEAAQRAARRL